MKKYTILLINMFIFCCVLFSCGPTKSLQQDNTYGVSIKNIKTLSLDTLTVVQFDSLITADKLPAYKKWVKTYLKDAETNESIEYSTLYDKTTDIIYTIKYLKTNKKYVVLKRKTIK